MKRFNFKLKTVLKYREILENLAKSSYQEAIRILNLEKNRLLTLEKRRNDLMPAYNIKAGTIIDPEMLSLLSLYTVQLFYLIEMQKEVIIEKEKTVKEKYEEWDKKRKDVKVIKRLEEKKWKEYLKEAEKEEQKFNDEVFIAKTVRGMER
jgi:flagellar FliJ protein